MTCAEKTAILAQLYAELADIDSEINDNETEHEDLVEQRTLKLQAIQVVQMQGCT